MSESYEVGTRAWQPDQTEGWVPSEVEQKIVQGDKVRLIFRLDSGEVCVDADEASSFPVTVG
jgi:myosin-5